MKIKSLNIQHHGFVSLSKLLFSMLASGGFAFATQVLLARSLNKADYGTFVSVLAIIALLAPLAGAGVHRFWIRVFGREGFYGIRWLQTSYLVLVLSIIFILAILWLWSLYGLPDSLYRDLIFWLSPLIIVQVAIDLIGAKFQLEERFGSLSLWQSLQNTFRFIWVLTLCVYTGTQVSVDTVVLGYLFVAFLLIIYSISILRKFANGNIRLPDDRLKSFEHESEPTLKETLYQSFPFAIVGLTYVVYFQSDVILLMHLANAEVAAVYNVAFTVMIAVYLIPNVFFQKYMLPKLHRWANHDFERFYVVSKQGRKVMLILGLSVMSIMLFTLPWLIPLLFGNEYAEAVLFLNILAFCVPFRYVASSFESTFISHNQVKLKMKAMVVTAVINVFFNLWLIPLLAGVGAAIATLISEISLLVFFYLIDKRQTKLDYLKQY